MRCLEALREGPPGSSEAHPRAHLEPRNFSRKQFSIFSDGTGLDRRFRLQSDRPHIHVRPEELMVAAAIGLGVAQCKVCILQ